MVPGPLLAQNPAPNPNVAGQILKWSGTVEFSSGDAGIWRPAYTNAPLAYNDRVRTAKGSRATIQLSDRTHWEMDQESLYQFPPSPEEGLAGRLLKGLFYLFHRDRPGTHSIETPVVRAGVRGTEYVIEVIENGPTTLWVLDGEVTLTNAMGVLTLRSHEAGITRPGEKPEYTAMLDAASLVQWVLYYPGVLHVEELRLGEAERAALRESIEAYRAGDLPGAAALYPQDRQPESAMDKVYRAAVLLAVGRVDESEQWLAGVGGAAVSGETVARLAAAVRGLIATVKGHPPPAVGPEGWVLASEWLSESYARQARFELPGALEAARRSVEIAPDFGYGWERVAELEFGFGRVDAARKALARASALSPRNAQAAALEGFLLAADNRIHDAMDAFDRAIALDSSLGNGWLGRGLCRIKRGDLEGGRGDLQVAAMSEPRRGVLRSYLGKAFQAVGDTDRAAQELDLAREIDPNDPTAWLYSALLKQESNRINPALRDLEQSQVLNDNRAVYRSSELLDQDKALRGANLANLYRDAGMNEVSVREEKLA